MATKTQSIPTNETFQLNKNTFVRNGYRFLGWGLSRNADHPDYEDEGSAIFSGDRDLYALWEQILYNVIFDP